MDQRSISHDGSDIPAAAERAAATDHGKDPAEQEALARDLGEELTELFVRHVRGEVDFPELTFATHETLQDVHLIATGAYELEDDENGTIEPTNPLDDRPTPIEQQEDLAQEPAGP